MIELKSAALTAGICPSFGGGMSCLDTWIDGARVPLLRPLLLQDMPADPFEPNRLACYPLVPWSNRIDHGGFEMDGTRVALSPNRLDDPYPIHGTGWQRAWQIAQHAPDRLTLTLDDATPGAYAFHAEQVYALRGDTLYVSLTARNQGKAALPFGLGLHPFFSRHGNARLRAEAKKVWLNDGRTAIPTECVAAPSAWDFSDNRMLPGEELNHCFIDWSGQATIEWPDLGLALDMATDMDKFILYTPVDADFFCFEPVDHCIDAVHRPGGALTNGMTLLRQGEQLTRHVAFRVRSMNAHATPLISTLV